MDKTEMETVADKVKQLALDDAPKQSEPEEATNANAEEAPQKAAEAPTQQQSAPGEAAGRKQGAGTKQKPPKSDVLLDPAVRQALIDTNRPTVLKLEEAVLEFLADSSKASLEFPPSTSNYERLLQHKVAQHYLLQTSTAMVSGTPRVVAKRPDKLLGSKDSGSSKPQVLKLGDVDVASIKVEPKALIRRPPSANSMRGPDGGLTQQQQQQQRQKSHKEREAEYHEARERLLGNSLAHGSGSTGNLAAMAAAGGNQAGSRPGSAGPKGPTATMGAEFLAAVPPKVGERGFNLVNPGRGAGRGSPAPGRGAGGRGTGGNGADDTAAAADAAADADSQQQEQQSQASGGAGGAPQQQQQQQKQQKKQKPPQQQQQQQRQQQQQQQQFGGGRGPKAVYRDRQRDEQDPDYARGVDRFQARFDPGFGAAGGQQAGNMYNMPTYSSEFPSLGPANGAGAAAAAGGSRHHARSGSMGASSGTAANGSAQHGTAFHRSGSAGNIPGGPQQQQQQQQQGPSSKAQQRHQQYQAAQQQQQMAAAGAQWGYYPPGPSDPAAAAAMYNHQMAAAGAAWGYGMAGPMDPSMAAAAAAGYAYGGYTPWGWGPMPAGGVVPGYGQPGPYGPGMMGAPQHYGQHQQQQQYAAGGGAAGGGRGGARGGGGKAGGSSQ